MERSIGPDCDAVLRYRADVERIAAQYGMSQYVELILAVMMQESGSLCPGCDTGCGGWIQ